LGHQDASFGTQRTNPRNVRLSDGYGVRLRAAAEETLQREENKRNASILVIPRADVLLRLLLFRTGLCFQILYHFFEIVSITQ
jgi:hypothetical protein